MATFFFLDYHWRVISIKYQKMAISPTLTKNSIIRVLCFSNVNASKLPLNDFKIQQRTKLGAKIFEGVGLN
jgi:hypothetical protein